MKRKDDDLLRLAFGELAADSARAVEARTVGDASAQADLEAMRELRAGLQRLPPPPPDTLSAERLRAAILDRELRSRRPVPFFAWAWAPVAVAALAAVLVVSRPALKGDPQVVANPSVLAFNRGEEAFAAPSFDPIEEPIVSSQAAPSEATRSRATVVRASEPAAPARRRSAPRRRRSRAVDATRIQVPTGDLFAIEPRTQNGDPASAFTVAAKEPDVMAAPTSSVVEGGPYSGGPESVVIVSSKRDLDTGARAATETEASNVFVGG